jgi:hypothetical protein
VAILLEGERFVMEFEYSVNSYKQLKNFLADLSLEYCEECNEKTWHIARSWGRYICCMKCEERRNIEEEAGIALDKFFKAEKQKKINKNKIRGVVKVVRVKYGRRKRKTK